MKLKKAIIISAIALLVIVAVIIGTIHITIYTMMKELTARIKTGGVKKYLLSLAVTLPLAH